MKHTGTTGSTIQIDGIGMNNKGSNCSVKIPINLYFVLPENEKSMKLFLKALPRIINKSGL